MRFAAALVMGLAVAAHAGPPLPFDLGGPFELVDQYGRTRSEADPQGRAQLLFFGYANCPSICASALPHMAQIVDLLAADGVAVTPLMITVDPDRDRVDTMAQPLAALHADFIGLTGTPDALGAAYDAFAVEVKPIFEDPEHGWIYAHGSFIHLLDKDGEVLTLLPPVLDPEQAADIVRGHIATGAE
jgi:protein SCO1/2